MILAGALRRIPCFPCNPETAIFQRFAFLVSEWSVSGSAPIGRYIRFLEVVVEKGYASLRSAFPMRSGNGGIPTILDFGIGMVNARSSPNRKIRPFSRSCG